MRNDIITSKRCKYLFDIYFLEQEEPLTLYAYEKIIFGRMGAGGQMLRELVKLNILKPKYKNLYYTDKKILEEFLMSFEDIQIIYLFFEEILRRQSFHNFVPLYDDNTIKNLKYKLKRI